MGVESHDPISLLGETVGVRLRDQVALVVGAARGLGLAIARVFGQEGARLALADVDAAGVEAAARELQSVEVETEAYPADVTCPDHVDALVLWALGRFGRIDVLVDCAAVASPAVLEETGDADWDRALAVNLKAAFLLCRAVAPHMKEQGYGRILCLAPAVGRVSDPVSGRPGDPATGLAAAVAAAGVMQLTRTLARQLAPWSITANTLAVGSSGPPPAEVASAALFLASRQAGHISGETLSVTGGHLP